MPAALAVCLLVGADTRAEPFVQWSSSNVQALWGERFEVGPRSREIVTLEHAQRNRIGDFYAFVDLTRRDGVDAYAELSPRLRLSRADARPVYVAGTLELAERGVRRYLVGFGTDLAVPGFSFLRLNVYRRDNPALAGGTWQLTASWLTRFRVGRVPMVFEGFADLAGPEDTAHPWQLVVPRLLADVGPWFGAPPNRLHAGLEWQYWHNKFGLAGVTESVPQLQVKLTL